MVDGRMGACAAPVGRVRLKCMCMDVRPVVRYWAQEHIREVENNYDVW
jgi:hypothetical protein